MSPPDGAAEMRQIIDTAEDVKPEPPRPLMRELPPAGALDDARIGTQHVSLESGRTDAAIYARERLGAGACIEGPAIITQLDATTLLLPGQVGTIDRVGSLIVREG